MYEFVARVVIGGYRGVSSFEDLKIMNRIRSAFRLLERFFIDRFPFAFDYSFSVSFSESDDVEIVGVKEFKFNSRQLGVEEFELLSSIGDGENDDIKRLMDKVGEDISIYCFQLVGREL